MIGCNSYDNSVYQVYLQAFTNQPFTSVVNPKKEGSINIFSMSQSFVHESLHQMMCMSNGLSTWEGLSKTN